MRFWPFSRKSITPADLDELVQGGGEGRVSRADALRVPAVSAAIQIISEAVASLDVMVKRIDKGVEIDVPDHQMTGLLRVEVNEWTSSFEAIRQIVIDALTSDQGGMLWVNRVDGRPVELVRYVPGVLTFDSHVNTGERTYRRFGAIIPSRDVIHLLPPLGKAPLSLAMDAISTAAAMDHHANRLFKSGARPSGVLTFAKGMGEEALKKSRLAWINTHENGNSFGKTAILFDGAEYKPFALTSTDAQFLENRKFAIQEIARAFNIPAPMLGDLDRATWANTEAKGREFLSYTLEPWLLGLEGALRRALFSDAERGSHIIRFDRDDLTRADLATRATAINSLIASQSLNSNEARGWLGLPPRPGGDEFLNPNITAAPAAQQQEPPSDAAE